MEAILRVSPEQLINTANEFSSIGNTVRTITASLLEKMTGFAGIYESAEATEYMAKARGLEDDIARLNGMIQEHVNDLNDMAQRYIQANSANAGAVGALQGDVIV